MKSITIYRFFLISIVALFISSCGQKEATTEPAEKTPTTPVNDAPQSATLNGAQFKTAAIVLGLPEEREMDSRVKVTGRLELPPDRRAQIGALTAGEITALKVIPGDRVKKGQELARMSHPEIVQYQEDYLKNMAKQQFAADELKRQEELEVDKVGKTKNLQRARADFDEGQALLEGLRKKMKLLNIPIPAKAGDPFVTSIPILAPIDGVVVTVEASMGQYIQTGAVIVTLADASHLHLALQVYERDLSLISPNQIVEYQLVNQPAIHKAKVISIAPYIDPQTRAAEVHAEPENHLASGSTPNAYINGFIKTGARKTAVLPEGAFVRFGEKEFIFVTSVSAPADSASKINFEMLEVSLGAKSGGMVAFQPNRPLENNEKAVLNGAYFILSEMRKGEGEE